MSCHKITDSLTSAVAIAYAAWNIFLKCFVKEHLLRKNSPWPMTLPILKTVYLWSQALWRQQDPLNFWLLRIITNLPHIVYAYRLVSVQSIHGDHCSLKKNFFGDIHKENYIIYCIYTLNSWNSLEIYTYFQFNAQEKLFLFHYALGKPKHAKMKKNIFVFSHINTLT